MFGNQVIAIKAFVIILLVGCIIWILRPFNFTLPKVNFKIEKEAAPVHQKTTQPQVKIERQTTKDIVEKINQPKPFGIQNPQTSVSSSDSKSLLKELIK